MSMKYKSRQNDLNSCNNWNGNRDRINRSEKSEMLNNINSNVNFGYSTRLPYDNCAYEDRLAESLGPLSYRLNPNSLYNCEACLSTLGPRGSYGASLPVKNVIAPAQAPEVVNIESILTNRNVPTSKCRKNEINPIDVKKIKLDNPKICNDFLNPLSSRLSFPPANYRELSVNRFYDQNKNRQAVVFYDFAVNSTLEAIDNFDEEIPEIWSNTLSVPHAVKGSPKCKKIMVCPNNYTIE